MASDRSYLEFILEQLSGLEGISHRPMMGEFLLYYDGKVFGGIYDDRFLVKDTPAARRMMPDAQSELPYPGARPMLLVSDVDDPAFLSELVCAVAAELSAPKPRRSRH